MAGTTVTPSELISKLQTYKYVCAEGSTILGPLKSAPKVEADVETKDVTLYETGSEAQASYLVKNQIKLTLELEDVDTAITKLAAFAKGDNVLNSTGKKTITLTPITSDTSAKVITFTDAYLQPGLSTSFADDETPNSVQLVYLCKPNASTGKPFTFTGSGSNSSSN